MRATTLQIAKPCHENWDAMTAAERGRHCASCRKTVVDIASMPTGEAVRFLHDLGQRLQQPDAPSVCVRAPSDGRGRLLKPSAKRYLLTNGLAAILAVSMSSCGSHGESSKTPTSTTAHGAQQQAAPIETQTMMGKPAPPQPTTLRGEVSVTPPAPHEMGKVVAQPAPEPRAMMGDVAVAPTVMGGIEAVDPTANN